MDEYIKRSDAVQCARDVANDFKNDGLSAEAGGADTVGDWLQDFPAADVLVPAREFNGKCHEMRPCGKFAESQKQMPNTPLTNRASFDGMTDEQLAHWFVERVTDSPWCRPDAPVDPETKRCQIWDCEKCALEWLRQEAGQCTK